MHLQPVPWTFGRILMEKSNFFSTMLLLAEASLGIFRTQSGPALLTNLENFERLRMTATAKRLQLAPSKRQNVRMRFGLRSKTAWEIPAMAAYGPGCSDVALVLVEIIDKDGVMVPTASNVVTFSHSGSSLTFLGGGNGDPASHTNNKASTREAFGGKLLGILAQPIHQGRRRFVSSPGLEGAE